MVELTASGDADQVEARLREALDAHGLQLFARIDHAAGARKADVELEANVLLIFKIEADAMIPAGTHQVRMEFAYDGGGPAKGGTVSLYLDGDKTGEGRVEATVPLIFSADETADVGRDTASPVSDDYEGESSVFTGTVHWVQIDLGEDAEDADHLITPEERLRVAMARQ